MNANTPAPVAPVADPDPYVVRFYDLYNRSHLWPEERQELQTLADRFSVRLRWYRYKFGDPKAQPIPVDAQNGKDND